MNSSTVGGSGALAEYIDAGSAPMAITTGIFSPRLRHLAPVRRADLVPLPVHRERVACPVCCTRYIPTLRMPALRVRVITIGSVMYGPPSSGQQVMMRQLVEIHLVAAPHDLLARRAFPSCMRGGNFATSISRGSIDSLPMIPSGTLRSSSLVMRSP